MVGIISGIEATNSQTKVILAETQFVQQAQVAATELADIETTKEFVLAQANATITQVAIEQDISFVYVNALWNDIEIIDLIQLDKLVEKYPNQPNSYRSRGGAYYILENYPAALDDYNKAISLNPNFAYAYHNRGNVYIRLGEYETALSDYNQAIELAPEFAVSYYNLGNTYYLMEEFEKAIESYDQAIFHDPNYVYAYHNRGITYSLMGELEKAIESYDQAILLAPDYELFINYQDEAYSLLSTQESADNLQQPTSDLGGHAFGGASAITNTPQAEIIFTPAPQDANAPTTTPTFSFGGGGVDG